MKGDMSDGFMSVSDAALPPVVRFVLRMAEPPTAFASAAAPDADDEGVIAGPPTSIDVIIFIFIIVLALQPPPMPP